VSERGNWIDLNEFRSNVQLNRSSPRFYRRWHLERTSTLTTLSSNVDTVIRMCAAEFFFKLARGWSPVAGGWGVWTGFGPFEKPSAPAFSVHAEIRALS
jgi:hypothetical protein